MKKYIMILCNILCLLVMAGNLLADDLVRSETRVDSAWSVYGVDGSGVIVAILDRGIDYEHPDFINPDGSTRILYIYDMLDDTGANDPNNPYGIGTIYTQADIDGALLSGVRLATRDAVGHGTATAGLAGGNGQASGGLYAGMAPGANFIIVKITSEGAPAHGNEPPEDPFYDPSYIPVGIDFVLDKAAAAGMPAVLLANFGSIGGPMDGSSATARAIDERFGPGHPGRIFITGSSDDGGVANHAAGTISQGESIDLQINKNAGFLILDLWYADSDRLDVEIITPTASYGPYISPVSNGTRDQQFTSEFNYYHNGSGVDFYFAENNRREIYVSFNGAAGTYTLRLSGAQISDGSFQASLNPARIFAGADSHFESFAVPGHTVWELAAAQHNIAPNSYVLRASWVDINGITRTFPGNEAGTGALWPGSGVGPTYDGRLGITVSAPGNSNITAYAQRSYFATLNFNRVAEGGGQYGILGAVSGAAPVLTGIVALMLEANPNLDADQVKTILHNSARSDTFTGTTPNPQWGYGKVNARAAVAGALDLTGIDPIPSTMAGSFQLLGNYPNPFNPATVIRYQLSVASEVELSVYDLQGRKVRTLVAERQAAGSYQVDFNAEGLGSGVYFYRLSDGRAHQTGKALLLK